MLRYCWRKFFRVFILYGLDEIVDEVFARNAAQAHVGEVFQNLVADGVHEVGLAQAAAAVYI